MTERYSHPLRTFDDGRLWNGRTKLTETDKAEIRTLLAAGVAAAVLAARYAVHRSRIYQLSPATRPTPNVDSGLGTASGELSASTGSPR